MTPKRRAPGEGRPRGAGLPAAAGPRLARPRRASGGPAACRGPRREARWGARGARRSAPCRRPRCPPPGRPRRQKPSSGPAGGPPGPAPLRPSHLPGAGSESESSGTPGGGGPAAAPFPPPAGQRGAGAAAAPLLRAPPLPPTRPCASAPARGPSPCVGCERAGEGGEPPRQDSQLERARRAGALRGERPSARPTHTPPAPPSGRFSSRVFPSVTLGGGRKEEEKEEKMLPWPGREHRVSGIRASRERKVKSVLLKKDQRFPSWAA